MSKPCGCLDPHFEGTNCRLPKIEAERDHLRRELADVKLKQELLCQAAAEAGTAPESALLLAAQYHNGVLSERARNAQAVVDEGEGVQEMTTLRILLFLTAVSGVALFVQYIVRWCRRVNERLDIHADEICRVHSRMDWAERSIKKGVK